ncbi:hypothetical protein B0A50_04956 [Salinomyces thailandicus]|uniref:Uncharacterized protein n=1 Tax=Salinomyces thailandicus TaxID=706561 RepID=A0A4U0TZY0_9PEZI|nr:hypothetical protein B0A50_04956 [Salinomyces thailandica]
MHFVRSAALAGAAAVAVQAQGSSQCTNGYVCNSNAMIQPTEADANTLTYAYAIQNLLVQWYDQYSFSESDFSALPNADAVQMNGQSMAANVAANFAGLKQQATLGLQAIQQLGDVVGASMPSCDYNLPPGLPNVTAAIMSATLVEATLCGAFIGGADYVYHPEVANLMARMSAEHGIHGSFLHTYTQSVPFSADSMALTPAFTPDQILSSGMGVGYLGDYIPAGCVSAPAPPCNAPISFGPLLPTTMANNMTSPMPTTAVAGVAAPSGMAYGTGVMGAARPTAAPVAGGAASNGTNASGSYAGSGAGGSATSGPTSVYTGAAAAPTAVGNLVGALGAGIAVLGML